MQTSHRNGTPHSESHALASSPGVARPAATFPRTPHRLRTALLTAFPLALTAATALAQPTPAYDAAQLPATQGKVAEYSLTPRGDVDGLILTDGTEVHLPPHLGTQLVFAVKPGDSVTIHGLKARAIQMVQAMSVANDATGNTVTDSGDAGPRGPRGTAQPLTAESPVKAQLHGPRGDLNGALLEDGTIVRLPPPEAQRLAADLTPGAPLYVAGEGFAGPLGRVIAANAIGPNPSSVTPIDAPPPRPGRRPPPPAFGRP